MVALLPGLLRLDCESAPVTLELHPAIAVLALLATLWLVHRALKPCKCCTHNSSYNPNDFDRLR